MSKYENKRSFRGGQSYNYWGVNDSYTSYRDGYTAAVTVHGSTRPNLYIK